MLIVVKLTLKFNCADNDNAPMRIDIKKLGEDMGGGNGTKIYMCVRH